MIRAKKIIKSSIKPNDTITLAYEDRFRRRIKMVTDNGTDFLLDLPQATELVHGNDLVLDDGRHVRVVAAKEYLMKVIANDSHHLLKIAWHIGNRHLACEILENHLLLRYDHVICDMIQKLGATVEKIEAPFNPQGGAYGIGRTHSHDH